LIDELNEFEQRFLEMKNESLDFGQESIIRLIREKSKSNWWARIWSRKMGRIDANLISATLNVEPAARVGQKHEKIKRQLENGASNSAILCSIIIAGVMRNDEIFTILAKFLLERRHVKMLTIVGILNPADVHIPLIQILIFVWLIEQTQYFDNLSVKPTGASRRVLEVLEDNFLLPIDVG
jgi:hypothetical protein